MKNRTRFAPTPSGYLHLGNALNFFLIWAWAKREMMSITLRIDDIDQSRFRLEYLDDIFASLDWLELDYQSGPVSSADFLMNFSQNLRMDNYLFHARKLRESNFAYFCNCSRKEIEENFGTRSYQGSCRHKALKDGAVRLNLENCLAMKYLDPDIFQKLLQEIGDITLVGRDNRATYQLVSVIEDVELGVTHVMRGEDLRVSTEIQKLLSKLLNMKSFSTLRFCFHALVRSLDGKKLAKSEGACALKSLYNRDHTPKIFYLWASEILGVGVKCESAKQLADSLPEKYFESEFLQFS